MSCVTKKPFSKGFTFDGVKSLNLTATGEGQGGFLGQKNQTVHVKGERFGERFFLYKHSNNKYIYKPFTFHLYHTCVFVRAYAREENSNFIERKSKMTPRISCYDCRYFSANNNGRAGYNPTPPMDSYQEGVGGSCRRFSPQHGQVIEHPNGETVVGLAEWPRVFTHDWCGEFTPRTDFQCPDGCQCKSSCSPKIKDMCNKQRPENN